MSETASDYVGKTHRYAQFRWDYAPAAIDRIWGEAVLRTGDWVADIGAGPGTLTRWFVERGAEVWAIEPAAEMRCVAEEQLAHWSNFHSVSASAEQTGLPDTSISLISVGRALHWFAHESARQEFQRILKPDGWLAVLAVRCVDAVLDAAVKALTAKANGFNLHRSKRSRPAVEMDFYFQPNDRLELCFRAVEQEDWSDFIGRIATFSGAPEPGTPGFALLEQAARPVFERFAVDDILTIPVETQVWVGHLRPLDSTYQGEPDQ